MKKKKVLATLMALTLTASMCPLTTYAANIQADAVETENSGEAAVEEQTEETEDAVEEEQTENAGDTAEQEDALEGDIIDAVGNADEAAGSWVLMNIPYDEFYEADMKTHNDIKVDAFSSATQVVVKNGEHGRGTYRVENAGEKTTDIHGVTFPVWVSTSDKNKLDSLGGTKITEESKENIDIASRSGVVSTPCTGKAILFAKPDYSYYELTNDEWNSGDYTLYKKATFDDSGKISFGKTLNKLGNEIDSDDIKVINDSGYTLTESSTWGDYQLDLSQGIAGDDITDYIDLKDAKDVIYGVVITTTDVNGQNYDYPLRHIENVWSVYSLAWNVGFSETVHGCKVQSDLYADMPGQSISYVTYYTNSGVYKVQLCDKTGAPTTEKVLKKYNIEVPAASVSTGTTTLKLTDVANKELPTFSDRAINVTVDKNLAGGKYEGGKITWTANSALPGSYTITVSDTGNEYAELSAELLLSTTTPAAAYDANTGKLVAASGSSATNLANFIKNITTVTVNGTAYSVSGRHSVKVINDDGSINLDAKSNNKAIFESGQTYTVVVASSGYPNLTFTVTKKVEEVKKVEIQKSWISSIPAQTYTGRAISPQVTVKNGNQALTKDVDYKITYANNTNAGTATVTVTGLGNYSGTASTTFTINKAKSTVTLKAKTATYNGRAIAIDKASVTGSKGTVSYKYYKDSSCKTSVSAANVKNAGSYYVKATVAADSNYNAATSTAVKLTISKAARTVTLKDKTVTYTGKKIAMTGAKVSKGTGTVTYKYYSNKSCTKAVSASKVKKAGTYYVKATVAANTNYKKATSKAAKLVIKPAQTFTYKKTSVTYKASALKSAKKTFKIGAASKQKGKITYTKASNTKKTLSVDKNGKVTVKKGLKKGTYTLKVKVTAAAKGSYGKTTVTKTVKVKVK